MDQMKPDAVPGMKMIEKKSGLPVLAIGVVWMAWAVLLPLYRLPHFVAAGLISLIAFIVLNRLIPAKIEYVAVAEPKKSTGDQTADTLIAEGRSLLSDIAGRRAAIQKADVAQKILRLEDLTARILAFVAENPGSAKDLRRFMGYYLPTLLKLAGSYVTFEAQGVSGENISQAMEKIAAMLDTMALAFERQLDALFADTALDITTDITAMEGILAQEGLRDGPNTLTQ